MIQSNGSGSSVYQQAVNHASTTTFNSDWVKSLIGFILISLIGFGLLSAAVTPSNSPATAARQLITRAAANKAPFPLNRSAALYNRASELGWGEPTTDEISFSFAGTTYVAQGFKNGILFTAVGHWSRTDIQVLN